jgi:adenine deaminase
VPDLRDPRPSVVLVDGRVVARDGTALFANTDHTPEFARNTVHLSPTLSAASFAVKAEGEGAWVQAMEMYDGYFKRAFHARLEVRAGTIRCDTVRDVLKIAIVDRHHATENLGIGYVRGFRLVRGAIAATTNCENQNLVIVGTTDEDIAFAARVAERIGGGCVVVAAGEVLGTIPLPVAGCMSDAPWESVRDASIACEAAARSIGCAINAPFMIMSFIGLVGVPDLGLTNRGLVETATQRFTDLVLCAQAETVCCRCPSHTHDVHRLMDANSFGSTTPFQPAHGTF